VHIRHSQLGNQWLKKLLFQVQANVCIQTTPIRENAQKIEISVKLRWKRGTRAYSDFFTCLKML